MNTQRYEAERLFYLKLNEKLFSYDVIRGNRFTDIVFVTAVKTGHSVKVYFDFLSNKVSFYSPDDEEIVCSLDSDGIVELYNRMMHEIEATYFVDVLNENESVLTLYGRISSPESDKIIEELCEMAQNIKVNFDSVIVTDFLGKYQRQFKFIDGKFE